jgi:hypothetical protein
MKITAYQHLSNARSRILVFASALVIALVAVVAVPAPAAAHNYLGWGWCAGAPRLCVSTDTNGNGGHYDLNSTQQGYCFSLPVNDAVTGIDSHIGVQAYFWKDGNCNGPRYNGCPGWCTVNNLGGTGYNDVLTSYCIGTSSQTSCGRWF